MTVARPWGSYTTLSRDDREGFLVKCIKVSPMQRLSLQSHQHRSEFWTVVSGHGSVTVGDDTLVVGPKSFVYIPRGAKHRLTNTSGDTVLTMVEVQVGAVLDEADIVRYEDDFGRA